MSTDQYVPQTIDRVPFLVAQTVQRSFRNGIPKGTVQSSSKNHQLTRNRRVAFKENPIINAQNGGTTAVVFLWTNA